MLITLDHVKEVTARAHSGGAYNRLKGRERIGVFIKHTPLKAGSSIRIGYNTYKIEDDCYLVYVDLLYDANFSHPVIFELHNLKDGSVKTIEEEFPLADPELERSLIPHILPKKEGK